MRPGAEGAGVPSAAQPGNFRSFPSTVTPVAGPSAERTGLTRVLAVGDAGRAGVDGLDPGVLAAPVQFWTATVVGWAAVLAAAAVVRARSQSVRRPVAIA